MPAQDLPADIRRRLTEAEEAQDMIRRRLADAEDRRDRQYDEQHPDQLPALDDGPHFLPHPDADFPRNLAPLRRPRVIIPPRPYRIINGHRFRLVGPQDEFDHIYRGHRYRRVERDNFEGVDVDLRVDLRRPDVPEAYVNLRQELVRANLQIRDLVFANLDFRADLSREQRRHHDQNVQIQILEAQLEEQKIETHTYRREFNELRSRVDAFEVRLRPGSSTRNDPRAEPAPARDEIPRRDNVPLGSIDIYPVNQEEPDVEDGNHALPLRPSVEPALGRWRRIRARALQNQYLNRVRNQERRVSDGSDSDLLED